MQLIPFLITVIFVIIGGMFLCVDGYHYLQQNSYYNSRYFKWLSQNYERYTVRIIWIAVILLSVALGKTIWITPVLVSAIFAVRSFLYVKSKQKKAIKPLVFTARVVRMFISGAVLLLLIGACSVLLTDWCFIALVILAVEAPFTAVLSNIINAPIEKMIRGHFIRDAKRILRSNPRLTVIGITGSFGKTSTKFILARILSEKYNLTYTPASFNTPMGVVRTVREQLKNSDQIFICEMGAKNIGDIKEICDIVSPDIGIITSVGPQHLETFKTVDNVAKTKFELADAVKVSGGNVYVNAGSPEALRKSDEYDCITYGTDKSDLSVTDISCGRFGSKFTVKYKETVLDLNTKLLGAHNVLNVAGAVAVALDLGVSPESVKYAVEHLNPVEHRLELKSFINGSVLIDDAYNANPSGSAEAVNVLSSFSGMKRIIVTPGLVELGKDEYECNKNLGRLAAEKLDVIILVGEQRSVPLKEGVQTVEDFDLNNLHIVPDFKSAMALLSGMTDKNTVVLFENDLPDNYAK